MTHEEKDDFIFYGRTMKFHWFPSVIFCTSQSRSYVGYSIGITVSMLLI